MRTSRGFTLSSTLVTMAIMSALVLGAGTVLHQISQNSSGLQRKIQALALRQLILQSVINPQGCFQTVSGITVNDSYLGTPIPLNSVKDRTGDVLVERGVVPKTAMSLPAIEEIRLQRFIKLGTDQYIFDLEVQFPKSANLKPIRIFGLPLVTASGVPTRCGTVTVTSPGPAGCRTTGVNLTSLTTTGEVQVMCDAGEYPKNNKTTCLVNDLGNPVNEPSGIPGWAITRNWGAPGWIGVSAPITDGARYGWRAECFSGTEEVRTRIEIQCCKN